MSLKAKPLIGGFLSLLRSATCAGSSQINMEVDSLHASNETQTVIKENTTEILIHSEKKVFYNPVQEFNRDLSVLALLVHSKEFSDVSKENSQNGNSQKSYRILEALSATGLRSIRYAKEIPGVTEVIANDISSEAVSNIETNIKHNKVENVVTPSLADAMALMINNVKPENRFQAVDLDPYGSPAPFLDSAIQCVADGGLLMVTCTDMTVLCGLYPETSLAKYGSIALKSQCKHEMGIRVVLQSIQSHASRYKRYIVPLLSISVDFYVRMFIRVYSGALECKDVISKLSMVYECCSCESLILQPLGIRKKAENPRNVQYSLPHLPELGGKCKHCGGAQRMGGPIWNGPIHDKAFVAEMLKSIEPSKFSTSKRLLGVLTVVQEELTDVPLFYLTSGLSSKLKSASLPLKSLRSAIMNAGYRVSGSHAARGSIKTDAPMEFIWDAHRSWVRDHPKKHNIAPGSHTEILVNAPIQHKIDFTFNKDSVPESEKAGLLRFQTNPSPNWGPGSKSNVKKLAGDESKKRKKSPSNDEKNGEKKTKNEENS